MKVLLTRPRGQNQLMVEALNAKGVSHIVTPLLQLEATPAALQSHGIALFQHADIIIFISTNAVQYASQVIKTSWPSEVQFYAIGEATLNALSLWGVSALQAPQDCQQTEGLLTLPQLQSLSKKKVVIVRGSGGREALANELTLRGADVSYWEVYRRTCPTLTSASNAQAWQQAKIDTIVITSGEILDNLIKLVPKELFSWLHSCHIIVPSSRVQKLAVGNGFKHITNAKAANCKAVLTALGL